MIAALPFAGKETQHALKRFLLDRLFGESERFLAGQFKKFAIAKWVGHVEAKLAGLAGAKELAGAAKLEIGFGNFKTVGGADHGFQARARIVGHAARSNQDAMGLLRAAANATAKLVQLGEAEAFRVLNDHHGGVGDIHTNLDDGGGHQNLYLVAAEFLHDLFFFFAGKTAVKQPDLEFGENRL